MKFENKANKIMLMHIVGSNSEGAQLNPNSEPHYIGYSRSQSGRTNRIKTYKPHGGR